VIRLSAARELRDRCDQERRAGKRIGFVPTMGYLHPGHLSLVERAKSLADWVVVSVFVNPLQFGPAEDLNRYPRDLDGDLEKCRRAETDLVFVPDREELYPPGFQSEVAVRELSQGLCGTSRPGHFKGVCTVVLKLLNLVGPCTAVFGEKDYQQLRVIERMVLDLNIPVGVVGCPIVREPDGLALSSRNAYLDREQRGHATCLNRALEAIDREALGGQTSAGRARGIVDEIISRTPGARLDYFELRDARNLQPADRCGGGKTLAALAVYFGTIRLIDNRVI
jgi:pantoate--beta-alanine ligase